MLRHPKSDMTMGTQTNDQGNNSAFKAQKNEISLYVAVQVTNQQSQ